MLSVILPSFNEPKAHATLRIVKNMFPDAQVLIAPDCRGQGKGWAVKKGFLASCGDIIVFLDADGDIHPRMLKRLLPFMEDYDIVVGSKAIGPLPLNRKLITLGSRIYLKIIFDIDFDSQTGIKVFKKESVLPWVSDRFMFDLELLVKAKRQGLKIIEIPVVSSPLKPKSLKILWGAFIDSLKIFWRLR